MATEGEMVTFSDKPGDGVPGCRTVVAAANDCLHNDSHIPARQVWCEYERGVLLLRGRLATYYQKQVAQEAVRGLDGVVQIVNNIEVDW
jgi:osmotically-inducible protein OsmY